MLQTAQDGILLYRPQQHMCMQLDLDRERERATQESLPHAVYQQQPPGMQVFGNFTENVLILENFVLNKRIRNALSKDFFRKLLTFMTSSLSHHQDTHSPNLFTRVNHQLCGTCNSKKKNKISLHVGMNNEVHDFDVVVVFSAGPEKLAETLAVSKEEAKSFMKSFLSKCRINTV